MATAKKKTSKKKKRPAAPKKKVQAKSKRKSAAKRRTVKKAKVAARTMRSEGGANRPSGKYIAELHYRCENGYIRIVDENGNDAYWAKVQEQSNLIVISERISVDDDFSQNVDGNPFGDIGNGTRRPDQDNFPGNTPVEVIGPAGNYFYTVTSDTCTKGVIRPRMPAWVKKIRPPITDPSDPVIIVDQ